MAERDASAEEVQPVPVELQLAFAGDHLRGERLVDLDQVDVGEGQARLLEDLLRRGHRADPHDLGRNPGPAHPRDAGEGLPAFRLGPRLGHEDHRGGSVGDARRVPRSDGSTLAEHGGEGREPFRRGVRTRVFVLGHGAGGLPRHVDPHDLRGAGGCAGCGLPLGLQRELVLLLPGDVVAIDEVLRGLAHQQTAERVQEAVAVHRVVDRRVAHPVAGAHAV